MELASARDGMVFDSERKCMGLDGEIPGAVALAGDDRRRLVED
jgi:hypothetical protein